MTPNAFLCCFFFFPQKSFSWEFQFKISVSRRQSCDLRKHLLCVRLSHLLQGQSRSGTLHLKSKDVTSLSNDSLKNQVEGCLEENLKFGNSSGSISLNLPYKMEERKDQFTCLLLTAFCFQFFLSPQVSYITPRFVLRQIFQQNFLRQFSPSLLSHHFQKT